jgi:hypothetical protein
MMLHELGKTLIVFGIILAAAGALLMAANKVPWLGRLPGDILIRRKDFAFYFPLATSIVVSMILSFIFWLWSRR